MIKLERRSGERLKIPASETGLPSLQGRRRRFTGHYWNGTKYTRMGGNLEECDQPTVPTGERGDDEPNYRERGLGAPKELTKTKRRLCDGNRHEVRWRRGERQQRRARSEIIYWEHGGGCSNSSGSRTCRCSRDMDLIRQAGHAAAQFWPRT